MEWKKKKNNEDIEEKDTFQEQKMNAQNSPFVALDKLADQIAERVVNPSAQNPVEFKVMDLLNNNYEKPESSRFLTNIDEADPADNLKFDDIFEAEEIKCDDEEFMWLGNNNDLNDSLDLLAPISTSFLVESSPLNLAMMESVGDVNKSAQLNKNSIEDSFEEQLKIK